jgi:HAD superfamily hydrolase (TIGR01459 family)
MRGVIMVGSSRAPIPILTGIATISGERKAWFCDVWGVLHDGITASRPAIDACLAFKKCGGQIVLISNSPRPSGDVLTHLRSLDVPGDCFDALVTSGDVTRSFIEAHTGKPLFHLGPDRDKGLFESLNVDFAPAFEAKAFVCTGFFNEDHEVPEDYAEMLAAFAARRTPMICANPDLYVERGSRLLPCAGLLAARYKELGQTVLQAGKPYSPIYDMAFTKLSKPLSRAEMLAIGDGVDTDIRGASAQGIDAIYIVSRVHIADANAHSLDTSRLESLFADRPFSPAAAMAHLQW